jgi:hypothetical protein
MIVLQKNPDEEVIPQDPAGTESQGVDIDDAAIKTFEDMMENDTVYQYPSYPYGAIHHVESIEIRDSFLWIECTDFNEHGLRPYQASMKVVTDLSTSDNSTNRMLACLAFFKWDGKEYHPCPLVPGQDDMRFIIIGTLDELQCKATM